MLQVRLESSPRMVVDALDLVLLDPDAGRSGAARHSVVQDFRGRLEGRERESRANPEIAPRLRRD